jgi:hypothetical protein
MYLFRVLTVVIGALALASGGCSTRSSIIAQTANSKKVIESKKSTEAKSRTIALRAARLISQTADSKIVAETNKFAKSNSRAPIPPISAELLSPQAEPSCEPETTSSNTDERQKLDSERQCYHHAEMIVRSRLQLLQDSVDKTISAFKRPQIPLPAAPLLSPQPEPSCELETTGSNVNERQKLDYERQCYRHAEMIVRSRLQLLQDAVDKTMGAFNRSERGGP